MELIREYHNFHKYIYIYIYIYIFICIKHRNMRILVPFNQFHNMHSLENNPADMLFR